MEWSFIEKNRCSLLGKDFIGAKKSSKVIHIGLLHKKIYEIFDEKFGKDGFLMHVSSTPTAAPSPLKKIKLNPSPQLFRAIMLKVGFLNISSFLPSPSYP